ncbi:MAG: DUF5615 family PIN-like protein [Rhodopirellula sp.]|nr:DUF5615 family PIN-like protein [Rhodopirellula sp.]
MARLYANENFPLPVVEALRARGHDVLTTQEAGKANQGIPDEDVLAYATAQSRAVITLNRRDFIRLHHGCADHAGIIVCTADADYIGQGQRIDFELRATPHLRRTLIRVSRPP